MTLRDIFICMSIMMGKHSEARWTGLRTRRPTDGQHESQKRAARVRRFPTPFAPFGVAYEKIGTIQRRLAWPLHKDDTLFRSGRPTGLNIYCLFLHGLRPMLQIHHRLRVVVAQALMEIHLLDPTLTRTRTGQHDENHSREGS